MKIIVPIKRVVDYNVKIRVKSDGSGIDLAGVKMSINPFDEIAVEEAVRLKEKSLASEVVVVSIGPEKTTEILRSALAMGADRAIHVPTEQILEPLIIAKLLAKIVQTEAPQLVIMGKQAIDDDCNQTGQMLAALLNWPQATFTSKLTVTNAHIEAVREIDGGLETLRCAVPAIVTTDLRLNEPRYIKLPEMMKAKSKPLATTEITSLGVALTPLVKIIATEEPAKRKGGKKLGSVEELVSKLKTEAGVL